MSEIKKQKLNINDSAYKQWLAALKAKVRSAQLKAAVKVNIELLKFYWELGSEIVEKQKNSSWGDGFLKQLSKDLTAEFPEMKGFSYRNIRAVKQWYLFWNQDNTNWQQAVAKIANQKGQQLVAKNENPKSRQFVGEIVKQPVSPLEEFPIFQIPWGHNLVIIQKCKEIDEAQFYVQKTVENGWSRNVLVHQIESDLFNRSGKAISNFSQTLPDTQSDLAQQTLKDPYNFDFLVMREKYDERELENALIKNIADFLLELGEGFSYVGKQYKLTVGDEDFYIDLLFYNIKLHSYVVIELKTGKFKPEYTGKLNFYISAVDDLLKGKDDNPTIGLLICKEKKKTIVEYALRDISKPMGISEYQLTKFLPDKYKSTLPSIEEIEREIEEIDNVKGSGDE